MLARQLLPAIASVAPAGEITVRAGLVALLILWLALTRYVLKLRPVAAMSRDDIVDHIGETLRRYICD